MPHISKAQIEQAIDAIDACEIAYENKDSAKAMLQGLLEQEAQPVAIDWPEYNENAMGCGLEDRNEQNSAYAAMRYGWDCAIESVASSLPDVLFTHPPAPENAAQWQPIETAPKDGRWLITFDGETVSPNYWLGSEIEHWAKTPLLINPTHWMSMPPPPEHNAIDHK